MKFSGKESARIFYFAIFLALVAGIAIAVTGDLPNPGHYFSDLRGSRLWTTPDTNGEFWILGPRGQGQTYVQPDDRYLGVRQSDAANPPIVSVGNITNFLAGKNTRLDVFGNINARSGLINTTTASSDPASEGFVYVKDSEGLKVSDNLKVMARTYLKERVDIGKNIANGFTNGGQILNVRGGLSLLDGSATDGTSSPTEGGQLILVPGTNYQGSGNTFWVVDNYGGLIRFYAGRPIGNGMIAPNNSILAPLIIQSLPNNQARVGINLPPIDVTDRPQATLDVRGIARATQFIPTSDIAFKTDVKPFVGALEKVLELTGVTFNWKEEAQGSKGTQVGLIAQDVEPIIPEAVVTSENGTKAVNYDGLVGVLIEAIKEQQKIIDSQQNQINDLEKRLEKLENQ